MKVVVFGATGGTGKHLIRMALAAGHTVTAFVRNPAALEQSKDIHRIIIGDARDAGKVLEAVQGQDAVFAAFGPRSLKKDDIQSVFMQNLISAMHQAQVKRIIELSAWGAGTDVPNGQLGFKIIRDTFLKFVFDDKNKAESLLLSSNLEYTLVRPGRLTDNPAVGSVIASPDGHELGHTIAREDVAAFMFEQVTSDTWLRKCPIIGYDKRVSH